MYSAFSPRGQLNELAFDHLHSELDIHRDFYSGTHDFAVSLGRVTVAHMVAQGGVEHRGRR